MFTLYEANIGEEYNYGFCPIEEYDPYEKAKHNFYENYRKIGDFSSVEELADLLYSEYDHDFWSYADALEDAKDMFVM